MKKTLSILIILLFTTSLLFSESPPIAEQPDDQTIVLLSGFGPFLNNTYNPSGEIATLLDGVEIADATIKGIVLPVTWEGSFENMTTAIDQYDPDIIISLGLFAGIEELHIEWIGLNYKQTQQPDGRWSIPYRIEKGGGLLRFSTLPVSTIAKELQDSYIPARVSIYAGTYICNHLLYKTLGHLTSQQEELPMCFIHLPQDKDVDPEGMEMTQMVQGVRIAIETAVSSSHSTHAP